MKDKLCQILSDLYAEYDFLLDDKVLTNAEKDFFARVGDGMDETAASAALRRLCAFLYKYYHKRVIILLDEYDTPMQEAYLNGYWEELSDFIRIMLHATFKDNPYMERGILTGITRVSKESVFSDLNNLKVVTVVSAKYETAFGFTEAEVFAALEEYGMSDRKEEVKQWYDGFKFGKHDNIYNPWSVINYLDEGECKAYWANTASNSLAGKLILAGGASRQLVMEDLLMGKTMQTQIEEEIIFTQLDRKKHAVWSLLLASGYLKIVREESGRRGRKEYVLALTNMEVRMMFDEIIKGKKI